jgi:hypothetical protein
VSYLTVFAGGLVLYLFVIFRTGKTFPLLEMFFFTYYLQYILATYLSYNAYRELSVQMALDQDSYFAYAVPALGFLFLGTLVAYKKVNIREYINLINPVHAHRYGLFLVVLSYSLDVITALGASGLNSILFFTTQLKYLGAFALIFSRSKINLAVAVAIFVQLALDVIQSGVFIVFFTWVSYLFFVACLRYNFSIAVRMSFIVASFFVLVVIQGVKDEYRALTWQQGKAGGVGLITDLAKKKNRNDMPFQQSAGVIKTVGRLSQGWHLGMTLKRVPAIQPFVDGEEMGTDVAAALIPRVIISDKKSVHSHDKFLKFTGWKLHGTTAMTIGLLGDFYINFGRTGSFIMLFIFGVLLGKFVVFFIRKYVKPNPLNFIWLPFILNYLIRADNDFYIVLNCAVKGFLIFLAMDFVMRKLWNDPPTIAPTR